jgi:dTMP kinase
VADRYLLANVVYQGHAGGLDPETLWRIGAVATGGRQPDVTIVLDVDLATAARRLDRPLDKLENRGHAYRERLRAGYLAEAARRPDAIAIVAADAGIDEVAERIRAVVSEQCGLAGG